MRNSRAGRPPMTVRSRRRHVGEGRVGDVVLAVDDAPEQVARVRPGDGELRPLLGDRDVLHVEVRPEPLVAELDVLHHLAGVGRGGGHEEVLVAEARRGAVVEDEAVLAQHQRRSGRGRPAASRRCWRRAGRGRRRRRGPGCRSCRASRRRRCRPPLRTAFTSRVQLASQSSPGRGEPLRAQPEAGLDEGGAVLRRPVMRGGAGGSGAECLALARGPPARRGRPACRAGGTWWCRSRAMRLAAQAGHDGEAVDVGRLALVGRHAERGVALEVLDRAEALALGERDVGGGDVVLEVDEGLALGLRRLELPERAPAGSRSAARHLDGWPAKPSAWRRLDPGIGAGGEAFVEGQPARRRAGDGHARRERAGHEGAGAASSHTGLPPRWVARWMAGVQPPDMASRSHRRAWSPNERRDHVDGLHALAAMHARVTTPPA